MDSEENQTSKEPSQQAIEERQRAAETLSANGCCVRCILRQLGHRTVTDYKTIGRATEILHLWTKETCAEGPLFKKQRLGPCVQCMDILTDAFTTSLVSQIKDLIRKTEFEFDDFLLSVTIPSCCLIREHVTQAYVREYFTLCSKTLISTVPSIKEAVKWIIGPILEDELQIAFSVTSSFDISINIAFSEDRDDCLCLTKLIHDQVNLKKAKHKKSFFSRSAVEKILNSVPKEDILRHFQWPPKDPKEAAYCQKIDCSRKSLYLAGRYNKYSRNLSQTPWLIDGEKLMETSIKELICNYLMPHLKADDVKFSASGREDVDVRTLGKGRPFVLEFINPRKVKFDADKMHLFQLGINNSTKEIAVRDLQIVPRDEITHLKDGEEEKTKVYTALCYSKQPLDADLLATLQQTKDLHIAQKTPIRVLHRRSVAIRERIVHEMRATLVDKYHFQLHLKTQAGTYVKEFVHSDFGRTTPNLRTLLGTEIDIVELDVEAVELDWPPSTGDTTT